MVLQTAGNVFAALIQSENYTAEVNSESGSLTYNLCVLAATIITRPLVYFFLRNVLRKNLPMLNSRRQCMGRVSGCRISAFFSGNV